MYEVINNDGAFLKVEPNTFFINICTNGRMPVTKHFHGMPDLHFVMPSKP